MAGNVAKSKTARVCGLRKSIKSQARQIKREKLTPPLLARKDHTHTCDPGCAGLRQAGLQQRLGAHPLTPS